MSEIATPKQPRQQLPTPSSRKKAKWQYTQIPEHVKRVPSEHVGDGPMEILIAFNAGSAIDQSEELTRIHIPVCKLPFTLQYIIGQSKLQSFHRDQEAHNTALCCLSKLDLGLDDVIDCEKYKVVATIMYYSTDDF
jgi:hypothetical protein